MKIAKSLSGLVAVAGLPEVLAPFFLEYSATTVGMGTAVIIGVVLIILAVWAALSENRGISRTLSWINVALGMYLILASFIRGNICGFIGITWAGQRVSGPACNETRLAPPGLKLLRG